jgi:hypothetical protein
LDVDCEKGLLLLEGPPNANEVDVFIGAATGACPKENPPAEDGVVGAASAGFWPKEKPDDDVFWPKPLNPRSLFSCFSSCLVAKGLDTGVLDAPPNENGADPSWMG